MTTGKQINNAWFDKTEDRVGEGAAGGERGYDAARTQDQTNRQTLLGRLPNLVVIGSSAGGPTALATLLSGLPSGFPAAVVIIQHLDAEFVPGIATWLDDRCELVVRVARQGDRPEVGGVLIAGTGKHLVFIGPHTLAYSAEPCDYPYCPSADVFFNSVAQHWRSTAVGILLTGMGKDGALGLKAMRDAGALTIAQDEVSSAIYGMPRAAAEIGAASRIVALNDIAPLLISIFS